MGSSQIGHSQRGIKSPHLLWKIKGQSRASSVLPPTNSSFKEQLKQNLYMNRQKKTFCCEETLICPEQGKNFQQDLQPARRPPTFPCFGTCEMASYKVTGQSLAVSHQEPGLPSPSWKMKPGPKVSNAPRATNTPGACSC